MPKHHPAANTQVDQEVRAAREKLKARFGDAVRIGGKGAERRKKKTVHKQSVTDDTKLMTMLKKYNMHQFPQIQEVNMFKDDNTVIHFDKPNGKLVLLHAYHIVNVSVKESVAVVIGTHQSKKLEDLLPDIIHQVGSKHYDYLKDYADKKKPEKDDKKNADAEADADDDDDDEEMPELVQNFEAASKKE